MNMTTIIKRAKKPTPRFFKKVRNIGLSVAAIGATIIAAPVALPAVLVKIAGYLAVAGSVMSGVSQVSVKNERQ
jgi:hypothetical protein